MCWLRPPSMMMRVDDCDGEFVVGCRLECLRLLLRVMPWDGIVVMMIYSLCLLLIYAKKNHQLNERAGTKFVHGCQSLSREN